MNTRLSQSGGISYVMCGVGLARVMGKGAEMVHFGGVPLGFALTALANASASAVPLFDDRFDVDRIYTAVSPTYRYQAADEMIAGTWTAHAGMVTYTRPISGRDPAYHYSTSILLTNGTGTEGGNTDGLSQFTVRGSINAVPSDNTAQPALIISASLEKGGYVLSVDNGQGSAFALLAVDGAQLLGDEGTPQDVVKNLGKPVADDRYAVVVTEHRPAMATEHPWFDVTITGLGPTDPGPFYSGTFSDPSHTAEFGGTQIGYRVRDPLDGDAPSFGPLSLDVPEPASIALLGTAAVPLMRRPGRR